MTYIKIGETTYPAEITGKVRDTDWNDRESKAITLEMTYAEAMETFVDELPWNIIYEQPEYTDASGNVHPAVHEEYDNSEFLEEIGSGVVSASGKAYTFCMDANGDWSSTILMKTSE